MASRLPTYLHPVAGRPLIWHAVAALVRMDPAPEQVVVATDVELPPDLFQELGDRITVRTETPGSGLAALAPELSPHGESVLVSAGVAVIAPAALHRLRAEGPGAWLAAAGGAPAAVCVDAGSVDALLRRPDPLAPDGGPRLDEPELELVADRASLARVCGRVRDELVQTLMRGGATFLLPASVLVDVDVRLGRDTIVYPGVVLEGQTTVGDETVIGPSCRIVSSWIGSGVELKGWNYVAHTSIRNRAILEPYVRRGFD